MVLDITYDDKIAALTARRAPGACWPWEGTVDSRGPVFSHKNVVRYVYERDVGPIPPGFVIVRTDHQPECDTSRCHHLVCVNPTHMSIEKRKRRFGRFKVQAVCARGHDLTDPDNVYEVGGRRWCKPCKVAARAEWERRNPNYLRQYRRNRKDKK